MTKNYNLLNDLYKEVEADRVSVKHYGDLSLFKYKRETHTNNLWNVTNLQARGIIVANDGTIVARPFSKFFNLGEIPATQLNRLPDESFEVWEKLDGSLGIGYFRNNGPRIFNTEILTHSFYVSNPDEYWRLATPGSFESEQAIEGTKLLANYDLSHLPVNCTPLFEIVYPENRNVVNYDGQSFLSLLAIIDHDGIEWHSLRVDQIAELCGFIRPRRYLFNSMEDLLNYKFPDNFEGFVIKFENGLRVKVKSPLYVRIHRLLDHMSPKGVIDLIRGREYGTTLKQLPKEIQKEFDDIRAGVQQEYDRIYSYVFNCYINLVTLSLRNRKEQALWIKQNVRNDCVGLVFSLLDNKDIVDNIWRLVLCQKNS